MTRGRNKKNRKAKAASVGWKAPNRRKLVAAKQPPAAPTMIIAEEPAAPSLFWPYEVLRFWWAPTVRLLR
jgi:hypothetical protein